jgi:hypothetical protein
MKVPLKKKSQHGSSKEQRKNIYFLRGVCYIFFFSIEIKDTIGHFSSVTTQFL